MRLRDLLFPVVLAGYFLFWAGKGLFSPFFPDEPMNLYTAWERPAWRLAADLLSVWNNDYRAFGAIFYRILYEAFGFQPLPFRLLCFAFLLLNIWLVYRLALDLTGNTYGALGAALVFAYQPYLSDLYMSSATLFDLLCFAAFWGAVLLYLRHPSHWAVVGLALLSMGSKEIAISLPVILLAADGVLKRRPDWRIIGGVAAIAIVMVAAKLAAMGQGRVVGEYVPEFSLHTLQRGWEHYWGLLLYERHRYSAIVNSVVLLGLLGLALMRRAGWARLPAFAFLVVPLPVLFIEPRSLYVFYLPYAAWALLWGGLAGQLRTPGLVITLVVLNLLNWRHQHWAEEWIAKEHWKVPRAVEEFRKLQPVRRGERILVVDDSIPADDWFLTTTLRLARRDRDLLVWRIRQLGQPEEKNWDRRVDFRDWRLRELGN